MFPAEGPPELAERLDAEGVEIDVFHGHSFYSATWGRWAEWRDGRLAHLAGGVDDDGTHFAPSPEYLDAMETLIATQPE